MFKMLYVVGLLQCSLVVVAARRIQAAGMSGEQSALERRARSESGTMARIDESYDILDVFVPGVMNNAVKDNMIAFTGGANKPEVDADGKPTSGRREQELSYHLTPPNIGNNRNGYNPDSGIQAYFAKDGGDRLPNDSNLPSLLTRSHLTSVGDEPCLGAEPCSFQINVLEGVEFETDPSRRKPTPPSEDAGQPYIKMRSNFIRKYGGDALDPRREECFLVFVHHNLVGYSWYTIAQQYIAIPMDIQVVGVTDPNEVELAWASTNLTAGRALLQSPNLCGVCVRIPVSVAWTGWPSPGEPEKFPCPKIEIPTETVKLAGVEVPAGVVEDLASI